MTSPCRHGPPPLVEAARAAGGQDKTGLLQKKKARGWTLLTLLLPVFSEKAAPPTTSGGRSPLGPSHILMVEVDSIPPSISGDFCGGPGGALGTGVFFLCVLCA